MSETTNYSRLEDQIAWYDRKAISAQRWFKATQVIEIICAALIPFLVEHSPFIVAILGVGIVIIQALQELNHWQHNWITYRATCEALRHEKFAYLGRAGVYDDMNDEQAKKVLVDRVEALLSTEHSKWISKQETTKG